MFKPPQQPQPLRRPSLPRPVGQRAAPAYSDPAQAPPTRVTSFPEKKLALRLSAPFCAETSSLSLAHSPPSPCELCLQGWGLCGKVRRSICQGSSSYPDAARPSPRTPLRFFMAEPREGALCPGCRALAAGVCVGGDGARWLRVGGRAGRLQSPERTPPDLRWR